MKKSYSVLTLALAGLLASCGGGEGASTTPSSSLTTKSTPSTTPSRVSVYVVPKADTVVPNNTVSLNAADLTTITLATTAPKFASMDLGFKSSVSLANVFSSAGSAKPSFPTANRQSYRDLGKDAASYTRTALDQSKAGLSSAESIKNYSKSNSYGGIAASNHVIDAQQGMTNVYYPANQIRSTANDLGNPLNFTVEPIRTNYLGFNSLSGSGVKFAIIDGLVNPSVLGFYANNRPQKIADSGNANLIGDDEPAGFQSHGSRVALIMIGKRSNYNSGYAPKATLKYYQLPKDVQDFDGIYKTVFKNSQADIINNSYTVSSSGGLVRNGTTYKNLVSEVASRKKSLTKAGGDSSSENFVEAVTYLANQSNAPLMVFAVGNLKNPLRTYHQYLQPNGAIDLTNQENRKKFNQAVDNLKITDGIQISAKNPFAIAHDYNDKNADSLLFVTGVSIDSKRDNQIKFEELKKKLKTTTLTSMRVKDTDPSTIEEWTEEWRATLAEANKRIYSWKAYDSRFDASNVVSSISSVKCGYLKYSCLAASFFYSTNKENQLEYVHEIHGTSFSAPMVSGVAALVKEQFPWMTAKQLKTTLLTTATDLGTPGVDEIYGWGLVNAYQALRGPAQFVTGDFTAKLSGNKNYYFQQDISGNGGLHLETPADKDRSILYLTGNNSYQGATVINQGASLAIVSPQLLKIGNAKTAAVTSEVYNDRGYLYAAQAKFGKNVYNNGLLYLMGSEIAGNLTSYAKSVTVFDARYQSKVAGKAEFTKDSEVVVTKLSDYFPVGSNRSTNQYATLLTADGGITTNFTSYSLANNALRQIELYTDTAQKSLFVAVSDSSALAAGVNLASLTDTRADKAAISTGANYLEAVFTAANNEVANTTSNEAVSEFTDFNISQTAGVSLAASTDLANSIVNASAEQVETAYLQAGATSYSHSVQAQYLLGAGTQQKFSQALANYQATKAQAYVQPFAGKQHWSQSDSKITGDYAYQGVTLGYLSPLTSQHSLALGFSSAKADFSQSYTSESSTKDTSKNTSLQLLAGYSYKASESDLWLVGFSGEFSNYKVTRQFLNHGSLSSKFNSKAYSLSFAHQYNFNLTDKLSLKAGAGLLASRVNLSAIAETSDSVLQALRIKHKAYARNLFALQLWTNLNYQQSFGEFKASLSFKQNLTKSDFSTTSFAQTLQPKFFASLALSQKINLSSQLGVEVGFNYDLSNSWHNYQVETKLMYQF